MLVSASMSLYGTNILVQSRRKFLFDMQYEDIRQVQQLDAVVLDGRNSESPSDPDRLILESIDKNERKSMNANSRMQANLTAMMHQNDKIRTYSQLGKVAFGDSGYNFVTFIIFLSQL